MLLDTHSLLWVLGGGERLGRNARWLLERADTVECSSISIAEIRIKSMLGRITVPEDLLARIEQARIRLVPYPVAAADGLTRWPTLTGHDPFDRMLLAHAAIMNVPLLTADAVLLALDDAPVIDARA